MARDITSKSKGRSARAAARMIHSRAVQDEQQAGGGPTAYRRAMNAVDAQVNRNSKTMKPETRARLKAEKDELRRLHGIDPGGPVNRKEKAKSRRNPTQPHHAPNKPRG